MQQGHHWQWSLILSIFILSIFLNLSFGSIHFDMNEWLNALTNTQSTAHHILLELRLPRTINALLVGASLATAGLLLQVLLRNPLAEPYILGTSAGATLVTLSAIIFGVSSLFLPILSFLGALLSLALLLLINKKGALLKNDRLLLTGVMFAALSAALINILLVANSDLPLRPLLYWIMGDLRNEVAPLSSSIAILISLLLAISISPQLNQLLQGETIARSLGINTQRLQKQILLLSALLTALAVSIAGSLGFIGLVAPHISRLLFGFQHKKLILASMINGMSLVLLADLGSRLLLLPQQLPVGAMTALLGAPLFIYLLNKKS